MATSGDYFSLPGPRAEGRLLVWLVDTLQPMSRTRVKQLLRHGRVSVNGATTCRHDYPLQPGDQVAIIRVGSASAKRTLEKAGIAIVLEDDALIVIDKPPGLLAVATESQRIDTAFAYLNAHLTSRGCSRPFVVHRLDRETSGLMLFARNAAVRDCLQASWDKVTKTYLVVVEGMPEPAEGKVENFLMEGRDLRVRVSHHATGARPAVSRYRVLSARGRYTLVQVVLETGRKHQIRVHMTGLGCPVIGDPLYGSASDPARRLGLHAHHLSLAHPTTGRRLELEVPLPAVLRRVVE